jgi:intein/homing endonuclease
MRLFELSNAYQQILDRIAALDPVQDETLIKGLHQELDALGDDAETKAVYYASDIKNMEAEIDQIDQAIRSMKDRKESLCNKVDNKKSYLRYHLEKMGLKEVKKSPYFVIRLKQGREIIDIVDESIVPDEYLRCKMIKAVDKIKCMDEIKVGVVIPGIATKRETVLEIK